MSSCEFSSSTSYSFHNELCDICDNISYVGITNDEITSGSLTCGANSDSDKWVQFDVSKVLDIPSQKPSMEGIVSVHSSVKVISLRVVKTPTVKGYTNSSGTFIPGNEISNAECTHLTGRKMIVEGIITQKVIYTALVADQAIHSATFSIPFSVFIIIDENTPLTKDFKVHAYYEDAFVCMLSERSIFSNNTLYIKLTEA